MRYFIGFFVTIVLLILLIVLLVNGGSNSNAHKTTPKALDSYSSTDAVTSSTLAGPINAESLHNSIVISVRRTQVVYQQVQGYNGNVVNTVTFTNSEASYNAFLRALNTVGFTKGDANPKLTNSQGVCPFGQRYDFAVKDNGNTIQHYWSSSCAIGTYHGSTNATLSLFQAQVPDYLTLTSNIQLN
jgi:hypothetical protein